MGLRVCSVFSAAASTWSGSEVSVGIGRAVPPRASTSRAAPGRPSSPRASRAALGPRGAEGPARAEAQRGAPADTAAGPGDHDHLVFMLVAHEGAPFVVSKAVAAG